MQKLKGIKVVGYYSTLTGKTYTNTSTKKGQETKYRKNIEKKKLSSKIQRLQKKFNSK